MTKGRLISIEGIDGVGKNTQAKLLHEHIVKTKGECGFFSFPRYNTPTGKLVGEYLKSGRTDLDLRGRAKLYADDRLAAKDEILSYLDRGVDVVCDRYITSNIVYFEQFARMGNPELVGVIGKEIEHNEFVINGIPKIDQLITLTAGLRHFDLMMESKAKREYTDAKLDQHEANYELIKGCHELYGKYGLAQGTVIECDYEGKLLDIDFISEAVKYIYNKGSNSSASITMYHDFRHLRLRAGKTDWPCEITRGDISFLFYLSNEITVGHGFYNQ
jgi:dTMP kinase